MRTAGKNGFTLIELLIVVTIIALLAGFLVPVLMAARKHARRINCSSNLRQIGQCVEKFSQDHREWLPFEISLAGDGDRNSGRTLGMLYPEYMQDDDMEVFVCPASDDEIPTLKEITLSGGSQAASRAKTYNYKVREVYVFDSRASYAYHRPRIRSWVEQTIIAADEDAIGTDYLVESIDPDTTKPYPPSPNHQYDGANCLWVDGHVTWERCKSNEEGVVKTDGLYSTDFGIGLGCYKDFRLAEDHLGKDDHGYDYAGDDDPPAHDVYLRISPDSSAGASP